MAFNIRKFSKLLKEIMYNDKCNISRIELTKNKYGAEEYNDKNIVYEDVVCKFSFLEKDSPNDSNGTYMPVLKQITLFTDLDYDIKAGDIIEGYRVDNVSGIKQEIKGISGEPNRFDTHQEIPLQLKDEN